MSGEHERALGRIEGKLDGILDYVRESRATDGEQDKRLNGLEAKMKAIWIVGPVLLAGATGLGYLKTLIGK